VTEGVQSPQAGLTVGRNLIYVDLDNTFVRTVGSRIAQILQSPRLHQDDLNCV
jgi:hypothetical protein